MINQDRIVPVTKTDLLSLYGTMITLSFAEGVVAKHADAPGVFTVQCGEGNTRVFLTEPVKSCDIVGLEGSSTAFVLFVPAYDFAGFTVDGEPVAPAEVSGSVDADGCSLYSADVSASALEFNQLGL